MAVKHKNYKSQAVTADRRSNNNSRIGGRNSSYMNSQISQKKVRKDSVESSSFGMTNILVPVEGRSTKSPMRTKKKAKRIRLLSNSKGPRISIDSIVKKRNKSAKVKDNKVRFQSKTSRYSINTTELSNKVTDQNSF